MELRIRSSESRVQLHVKRVDLYNWQLKHGTIDWIEQAFGTWQVDKVADHYLNGPICSAALMAGVWMLSLKD